MSKKLSSEVEEWERDVIEDSKSWRNLPTATKSVVSSSETGDLWPEALLPGTGTGNFFYYVKNWKVLAYQTLCSNHLQVVTVQMQ